MTLRTIKNTRPSLLAVCISLCSYNASALEALTDESLSDLTGQDGISFNSAASNIALQRLFWREDGKELQLRNLNIANHDTTVTLDLGADSDLSSATPAVAINITAQPFLLTIGSIGICNSGATCTTTFGEMALETTTTSTFTYFNTNGLFDDTTSNARFRFNVRNANLYFAQTYDVDGAGATPAVRNLAILKNLTFNGSINGKFAIDAGGLHTRGTLALNRSGAGSNVNGLQFDIAHKANVASGFTTTGSNSIMRFGMSGNILNYDWRMVPDNSLATTVANTQGVKMTMSGVLDRNTFQLELGHPSGYSVIFRDWVDFANGAAVSPSNADFTLGSLYFNLIPSTGTLPNFTTGYGAGFGQVGGVAADAFGIAVRGLNFQAYPRSLIFQNNTSFVETTQNWSLITALYNVDANLLMFPDGHPSLAALARRGIGFNLKMATTGRDGTGKEGTHILIADPTAATYVGWRNINSQITLGQSQLFIADAATDGVDGLKFTSNNMVFDLSGEFAVGRLPNGSSVTTIANNDELFGLRVRMAGSMALAFSPPPTGVANGYLGVSGQLNLNGGALNNSIVITEPTDGTELQFGNISGIIDLKPEHIKQGEFADRPSIIGHGAADYTDASRIEISNNTVTFATALEFGKGTLATDVVRIGDLDLGIDADSNPATAAVQYRLGEIVIPGGRLYTQINIKPQ